MAIELRQPRADDVPELGRICYEAFKDIAESHGFPTDFPSVEFAQQIVGMMVQQEDVYSIAAFEDGVPKGSNFLQMWDEIAGVGPVSVDISSQGAGIGRKTMEDVVAHAKEQGFDRVQLVQDSFNMRSLALYASIGFDVKEPLSYLHLSDRNQVDGAFRPATADDVDAMDELCKSVYGVSRKNEATFFLQAGFPGFVLDRGGVVGYLIGTAAGHGVAQNDADMLTLLNGHGASVPDAHSFVPLRNGELYRRALAAGHLNQKVVNMMAYGPYEEPRGTFVPSVLNG
jgi:ribosomal protein S18 acetylase RimI-like enzyme